jgi:hypothetical protein
LRARSATLGWLPAAAAAPALFLPFFGAVFAAAFAADLGADFVGCAPAAFVALPLRVVMGSALDVRVGFAGTPALPDRAEPFPRDVLPVLACCLLTRFDGLPFVPGRLFAGLPAPRVEARGLVRLRAAERAFDVRVFDADVLRFARLESFAMRAVSLPGSVAPRRGSDALGTGRGGDAAGFR